MTAPIPARIVRGDHIVCGRKVDGRYVCQGIIGIVSPGPWVPLLTPDLGSVEDPPGSRHFRMKADKARAGGLTTKRVLNDFLRAGKSAVIPSLPWTADCPAPSCRCVAIVTAALAFEAAKALTSSE